MVLPSSCCCCPHLQWLLDGDHLLNLRTTQLTEPPHLNKRRQHRPRQRQGSSSSGTRQAGISSGSAAKHSSSSSLDIWQGVCGGGGDAGHQEAQGCQQATPTGPCDGSSQPALANVTGTVTCKCTRMEQGEMSFIMGLVARLIPPRRGLL